MHNQGPFANFLYPQSFGVVGDGITDDSIALQKAFDVCAVMGKTLFFPGVLSIRVTKNLFIYGKFDLLGENSNAEIVLDADLDPKSTQLPPEERYKVDSDSLRHFWINFGIPKKGVEPITYTGTIANLTFRATANARVNRMLNFHNAERFTVSSCTFDVRAMAVLGEGRVNGVTIYANNATAIEGNNANNWSHSAMLKHGRILNNTCLATQGRWGGEGIGLIDASDILIEGNYIHGFGDDAIGCADIRKLTIAHNHCYTTDGRIKFHHCTDVRIIGNYCERIKTNTGKWRYAGSLIGGRLESKHLQPASSVIISNNQLTIPHQEPFCFEIKADFASELDDGKISGSLHKRFREVDEALTEKVQVAVKKPGRKWKVFDPDSNNQYLILNENQSLKVCQMIGSTTGIRLMGIRDATIANNQILCDSSFASEGGGIRIQADTSISDWSDPTGIDKPRFWVTDQALENLLQSRGIPAEVVDKLRGHGIRNVVVIGKKEFEELLLIHLGDKQIVDQYRSVIFKHTGTAVARARNIHITGNCCIGKHPQGIEQVGLTATDTPGPFYVQSNVARRYWFAVNTHFGANSVVGSEPNPMRIEGGGALFNRLLFEGACTNIRPGASATAVRAGTIQRFYIEKPTRVTYVDVTLDGEIKQNGTKDGWAIDVQFWKNDNLPSSNTFWPKITMHDRDHKRAISPGSANYDFFSCDTGDFIEIKLAGNIGFQPATGINAVVSVYGISW